MNDIPKWIRGIYASRRKLINKTGKTSPKHEEILDIHRPCISPYMKKHFKFVLWFIKNKIK